MGNHSLDHATTVKLASPFDYGENALMWMPAGLPEPADPRFVESLLDGNRWVPEDYRVNLKPVTAEEKDLAAKIATLTPQQYRVLCYLREGWLNKQIGYELGVTEATIKAHITAIFRKLGTTNRTQAVIMLSKMSLHQNEALTAEK